MNILHHKSYHVYNKKNIEKVKQDEAEAERQAKAKQDRVILAESEARLELLRKKANVNLPPVEQTTTKGFNLFEDIATESGGNPEHEAEVKQENEKWDKQTTMYLGQKEDVPWYTKNEEKIDKYKDISTFKSKHDKKRKRPIKLIEDPLDLIKSKLKKTEKKKEYKPERRQRHRESSNSKSATTTTKLSPIELLREKRLLREKDEKMRLNKLFLDSKEEEEEEEDQSGYNSQFNRLETEQAQKSRRHNKARRS